MAANGAAIDLAQEGVRGAEKRGVSILGLPAEKQNGSSWGPVVSFPPFLSTGDGSTPSTPSQK